jgi:hypothetical protein
MLLHSSARAPGAQRVPAGGAARLPFPTARCVEQHLIN